MNPRVKPILAATVLAVWGLLSVTAACALATHLEAELLSFGILYATGVTGLVRGYFWARWFARGLGWWGATAGAVMMVLARSGPFLTLAPLAVFLVSHVAVVLLLRRELTGLYDGQPAWRQDLDPTTRSRIACLFSNLGSALPILALWAFSLRTGLPSGLAGCALVCGLFGLAGLTKLRTWGVLATSGLTVFGLALVGIAALPIPDALFLTGWSLAIAWNSHGFVHPVIRWLRT